MAGRRLGALERGGGGGKPPPFQCIPGLDSSAARTSWGITPTYPNKAVTKAFAGSHLRVAEWRHICIRIEHQTSFVNDPYSSNPRTHQVHLEQALAAGGRGEGGGGALLRQNLPSEAQGGWAGLLLSRGGEGGRGFWTQNLVYQKWPDQIFPVVSFVFSHDGHFGLGRGGGGFGGGVPPPLVFNYSKEALGVGGVQSV